MRVAWRWLVLVISAIVVVPASCAESYGPVKVQLQGETEVWTEKDAVYETGEDALFQTERYGPRFSYTLTGLRPGPARIKLGVCEFKYSQPGQRVFSLYANGDIRV